MKHSALLLMCLLATQASAQSSDILSVLISQGYSILTSLTASLGQTATARQTATGLASSNFPATTASNDVPTSLPSAASFGVTTAPSTAASFASSLSSLVSSVSSVSSASASAASSLSSASITSSLSSASAQSSISSASSSGSAAAASATSEAGSGGGSNRDRNLAIILGTVLGALALGLLILLIVILCHRRRRRRAHGRGSFSSTSDEALAPHKSRSHVTPLAAKRSTKRRSLLGRKHAKQPVMTQRSEYDVPSAHQFGHGDTVPFVPTGASTRSSKILPTGHGDTMGTGIGPGGRFPGGNGLNNHPYDDSHHNHHNHHTGSMVAAGAGGAALGAAAARHSRSGERHHGQRSSGEHIVHPPYASASRSRSGERFNKPRLSGDADTHPVYWDEPPPRSPNRLSGENARRSGSTPKGTFRGPTDFSHSPLRNSHSSTPAVAGTGLAAAALADRAGHHHQERGRTHPDLSPSPGYSTDTTLAGSQVMQNGTTDRHRGIGPGMNNSVPMLPGQSHHHSHHHGSMAPAVGAAAVGAGLAHHSRSRSRSGPHPPLPSSMATGNANHRRSYPSRSPRRTRFSGSDMHHEPMPYGPMPLAHESTQRGSMPHGPMPHDPISREAMSERSMPQGPVQHRHMGHDSIPHESMPQSGAFRDGAISPPTAATDPWNPMVHPAHRGSMGPNEPVSPVSAEDMLRAPSHRMPGHSNRNSRISDPSPVPSVSPQVQPPFTSTTTTTTSPTQTTTIRHALPPRHHSGLVNAVQDNFDPNHPSHRQHNPHHPPPYQPFISETIRPSALSNPDTTSIPTSKPPPPLQRKPVPFSEYNNARAEAAVPDPGEPRRSGENWWRGDEDSAWQQSYSGPSIGHAR